MGERQRDGGRASHHADVMDALRRGRGWGALISSFYQCLLVVAGYGTSLNLPAYCASNNTVRIVATWQAGMVNNS